MSVVCPHCGSLVHGDDDLVAAWRTQVKEHDWPLVQGRVSEHVAACLVGMSQRKLIELRKRGCGPIVCALPVAGSRYSYELPALARFVSAMRSGDDWG